MQDDFDPNLIKVYEDSEETGGSETPLLPESESMPAISRAAKRLITFIGALVILVSAAFLIRDNVLVIRNLTVNGIRNVPWQTVALSAGLNASSHFLNLNESTIRDGINRNRYLVYLSMEKAFPNSLVLNVKERVPTAYINYIGIGYLMADDGVILEKVNDTLSLPALPAVSGIHIQDIQVGSMPLSRRAEQMPVLVELLDELTVQGAISNVSHINLTEPDRIYMTTREGYTVYIGDGRYLRAKIGTVRSVLVELKKQQYGGGVIEATVPGVANYRPEGN
ncbi:MAG: FtsQ-type POTRA domain-containing protein [Clostridiales bacterium]|jgi:cell division septal protein FtsQ|nr:FtsQ-type POTRA domain-containing protein [Clostridiales bacterium]